ncbi:MAG TPA: signal peptidase I, partial [Sphaerochaetaceae bacterium]|nr:signal peptidase I [Sphaerochaetaceae bacterium]
DILSQMIYMATFSLVNIDVDEDGNMRERLYVKRASALGGETVRFDRGTASIAAGGEFRFTDDDTLRTENGLSPAPHQTLDSSLYPGFEAYGALLAYQEKQLSNLAPRHLIQAYQRVANYQGVVDYYAVDQAKTRVLHQLDPQDLRLRSDASRYKQGIYVPHGYVLPLGDNRDNSHDGRYFGPVPHESVIGQVRFRFWPFGRMGMVN